MTRPTGLRRSHLGIYTARDLARMNAPAPAIAVSPCWECDRRQHDPRQVGASWTSRWRATCASAPTRTTTTATTSSRRESDLCCAAPPGLQPDAVIIYGK